MAGQIDWSGVREVIARAEKGGSLLGVSVLAPDGTHFSHNGKRQFVAASTVKIAIMIELFRQIDAGQHRLDQRHTLVADDKTPGSGVILHMDEGIAFTLGDLVYLMMSISDNAATNILIDRVGLDRVNATMRQLGMVNSQLGRKMRGRPVLPGESDNLAAPDDYTTAIAAILSDRAASPASCAQMVGLLEKQQNDRRIARNLPRVDRPRWGSKTGSLTGVVNDVGFIMTAKGPLCVAVFSEQVVDPLAGEQVIGDVASAALAAVT